MKTVIQEYASSVVALIATVLFFQIAGTLLFGTNSILAEMVAFVGGSGLR